MAHVPLYDSFSQDYDRFVNWETRLRYEWPFLERLLRQASARRVLDTACGTGHHAIALARAGYAAVGTDLSEGMIAVARQNATRAGVQVDFVVAGFGALREEVGGSFDVLLCLGNSLPHATTADALNEALSDFRAVLNDGGLLIIQNRNFDLICETRQRFMPLEVHREEGGEWLFLRFYDFLPDTIGFNIVTMRKTDDAWSYSCDSSTLQPIRHSELRLALAESGFAGIEYFGNLAGEPFDPDRSDNLVAVARAR